MGYYSKNTDRMDIHIEETRGTILIKQKWKYSWLTMAGATAWTYPEKKLFHSKVDNLIWNSWGNHFFLKVEGNSDFSKRNSDKKWDVNFDIEWVLSSEHWDVNVTKLPSNHVGYEVSSVRWDSKIITIDTKDTAYRKIQGPRKKYYQYPLVHEFGHAAGNTNKVPGMHGDEYKATSPYNGDKPSLMNLGNKLRSRHLDYVLSQLNTMVAGSTFSEY
jgi:hypothetical protein